MDLVRDLLDKPVVDRDRRAMGRVDSVILERRPAGAPRVAGFEIGPAPLAARLFPWLGRWVAGIEYGLGLGQDRRVRVPMMAVAEIGLDIDVTVRIGETRAGAVEQRLRALVQRIPGSR